jgi:hypothetical protein
MSLLTNDQIMELTKLAINKSAHLTLFDTFYDWNKDQIATPFVEPNWNDAPENAVQAVLNTFWVDEHGATFGVYKEYYNRPKPVITPHPHAEMIMKYAEVAQRRDDPWVEFEWGVDGAHWRSCDRWIYFKTDNCYRHIGDKNA